MRVLDLFCGAGGASMGLRRVWPDAEIVGVDINPQPRYPFTFVQADAMTYPLGAVDFIWASPPCQAYTKAQRLQGNEHPDLVAPIRKRLEDAGAPYCIENVPGAPLIFPTLLCGSMFNLRVYRHRIFETNFPVPLLLCNHDREQAKMGRPVEADQMIQVVGNFSNAKLAREAMEISWMTRDELAEAIPPAFSEFIAEHADQYAFC